MLPFGNSGNERVKERSEIIVGLDVGLRDIPERSIFYRTHIIHLILIAYRRGLQAFWRKGHINNLTAGRMGS